VTTAGRRTSLYGGGGTKRTQGTEDVTPFGELDTATMGPMGGMGLMGGGSVAIWRCGTAIGVSSGGAKARRG
jgi:hypothetical protein